MNIGKEKFKERLAQTDFTRTRDVTHVAASKHFRRASVLVPIFFKENIPFVLLTMRSSKVSISPDTISFPGGVQDISDSSDTDTALREAQEEIGLAPNQVEVLCHLPKSYFEPNYIVTPVVGIIPEDFTPVINPEEVKFTLHLPLSRFCQKWDYMKTFPIFDYSYEAYFFKDTFCDNKITIWGYTAVLCMLVAAAACPNVFSESNSDIVVLPPITAEQLSESLTKCFNHCITYLTKSQL